MTYQLTKSELRNLKTDKENFKYLMRNEIYIVLDSLKCAHNIGTILRLADALLVKKVYICGNTIVPPNRKIKTSSRGAERWVDWEYIEDATTIVNELKSKNVQIVAVEVTNDSVEYTDFEPFAPICLILGREFDGVSQKLLDLADTSIHLPLLGMSNSINVSTAASVALYYVYSKLYEQKHAKN